MCTSSHVFYDKHLLALQQHEFWKESCEPQGESLDIDPEFSVIFVAKMKESEQNGLHTLTYTYVLYFITCGAGGDHRFPSDTFQREALFS